MKVTLTHFLLVLSFLVLTPFSSANATVLVDFGPSLPGAPTAEYSILTSELAADYGLEFSSPDTDGVRWYGPDYSWSDARYAIAAAVQDRRAQLLVAEVRPQTYRSLLSSRLRGNVLGKLTPCDG